MGKAGILNPQACCPKVRNAIKEKTAVGILYDWDTCCIPMMWRLEAKLKAMKEYLGKFYLFLIRAKDSFGE